MTTTTTPHAAIAVAIGATPIAPGAVVHLDETAALSITVASDAPPAVTVSDEAVPMVRRHDGWRTDPVWIDDERTRHLVGECPLEVRVHDARLTATIVRSPTRIVLDEYRYLIEELQRRFGLAGVEDPVGRARIWAELAPRVPTVPEETARVLLGLFGRSSAALHAIAVVPRVALERNEEWVDVERLVGRRGRVDARRFRPWDPPRPIERPTTGQVLVVASDEQANTPENRYVATIAERFAAMLRAVAADVASQELARRCGQTAAEIDGWFAVSPWLDVPRGRAPEHSFVMRDDARYRAVALLGAQLGELHSAIARFPAGALDRLFAIGAYSLNVLYERWIQCLTREWLEHRLGSLAARPSFSGRWCWTEPQTEIALSLDWPFPRQAAAGVVAPLGKNRPDIAIEIWRDGSVRVLTLDATYSRSPLLHDDKLGYAANLHQAGRTDPLTARPPLVTEWSAVAFPGGTVSVHATRARLAAAKLSLPPGPESARVLAQYLDETIGAALDGRL